MLKITFELVKETDLQKIQSFVEALYMAYPGEDDVSPNINLTFAEFSRNPSKGQVIKLAFNDVVVGYAIIVFFWSNEFCGDVIEIDELFVAEEARGKGIGRKFFAWLESTYPHCMALALQVAEENEGASKLYCDVGFKRSKNQYLLKMLKSGASSTVRCLV